MKEPQNSAQGEKEIILKEELISEVTMDEPQTASKCAASSDSDCQTEAQKSAEADKETILEEELISEVTENEPQTPSKCAASSDSDCEAEAHNSAEADKEEISKEELISEVTEDEPQTPSKCAASSVSDCETVNEMKNVSQLRMFVSILTVRVLHKCKASLSHNQEKWATYIKRLINKTMENLTGTEDFCPDHKDTKKVAKCVLKDLQKKYGSRLQLECVIASQDPDEDGTISQSLQTHIRGFFAGLAKKAASRKWWKEVLQLVAIAAGFLCSLVLLVLI